METILYSKLTSIVPPQKPQYPPSQLFFKPKYVYPKICKPTKYYHFNLADSVETIRFCQKRLIQLPFNWGDDVPDKVSFFFSLCFTSAPFLFLRSSSSTFFPCLSVSEWGIGVTRTNSHLFQFIKAYKPNTEPVPSRINWYRLILTHYHQVPTIAVLYWPSTQLHPS